MTIMTIYASVADTKKNLSALLNQVTYGHERVMVTKRGKVVAEISQPSDVGEAEPEGDWLDDAIGLCRDCPEVCDAIDGIYEARSQVKSRPAPDLGLTEGE